MPTIEGLSARILRIDAELRNSNHELMIFRSVLDSMKDIMKTVRETDIIVKEKTKTVEDSLSKIQTTINLFFENIGL